MRMGAAEVLRTEPKRPNMSKEAAGAAVSTKCGFANGAAELWTEPERPNMSKEAAEAAVSTSVYCIIHISHNDLPEFSSAALLSIDDATASPHSSALQSKNSFCVILLKVDGTVHRYDFANRRG